MNVHDLPKIASEQYSAIHARHANLTGARVIVEGTEIFNASKEQANTIYKHAKLAPVSGYVHVIFDHNNRLTDALPMGTFNSSGQLTGKVSDFRLDVGIGSAAAFPLLTEVFGPRD